MSRKRKSVIDILVEMATDQTRSDFERAQACRALNEAVNYNAERFEEKANKPKEKIQ